MDWEDWTIGPDNRSNTSVLFLTLTDKIREIVAHARIGDDPEMLAGLIAAQLAHRYHMKPSSDTFDRLRKE